MNSLEKFFNFVFVIVLGFFGMWFYWLETTKELFFYFIPQITRGKMHLLQIPFELSTILIKFTFGAMILLWIIFGCIFTAIIQHQRKNLEKLAQKRARELQEQMIKEAQQRLQQMSAEEKTEVKNSGWLW